MGQPPISPQPQWFDLQRRVVSHMTTASWQNVPHVTYLYEPDITEFYEEFQRLSKDKRGAGGRLTLNTVLLRLIVEGLRAAPRLNAHLEYHAKKAEGKTTVRPDIHITLPWLLADGRMITPTLASAQQMTLEELTAAVDSLAGRIGHTDINELLYSAAVADTLTELKKLRLGTIRRILAAARHGVRGLTGAAKQAYYRQPESERLSHRDLTSGTVTVSNIGSLYPQQRGFFCLLEIIPPQVFAVGVGAVQEKPGVFIQDGRKEIGIRRFLPLCLAFDHRAVDFNDLVPFLKRLDEVFAQPGVLHTW